MNQLAFMLKLSAATIEALRGRSEAAGRRLVDATVEPLADGLFAVSVDREVWDAVELARLGAGESDDAVVCRLLLSGPSTRAIQ